MEASYFVAALLDWHRRTPRDLPWKSTRDPYKIWLSEIILQQTRVAQGLPYYQRFVAAYPDVRALAAAPDTEVFKLWEGLGYYSRARNLLACARQVVQQHDAAFPSTYKALLALPGIGPYTAAAIGSFAFDLPQAVVDGNVLRVLSRVFGIQTAIDSSAGAKEIEGLAQSLLPLHLAATYNQAIMNFGALQCIPKGANCSICPMNGHCIAFLGDLVGQLPRKDKKLQHKTRFFLFFDIFIGEKRLVQKRSESDIWQDLYQLPLVEVAQLPDREGIESSDFYKKMMLYNGIWNSISLPLEQKLTHQKIVARVVEIQVSASALEVLDAGYSAVTPAEFALLPFPRLLTRHFENNQKTLF